MTKGSLPNAYEKGPVKSAELDRPLQTFCQGTGEKASQKFDDGAARSEQRCHQPQHGVQQRAHRRVVDAAQLHFAAFGQRVQRIRFQVHHRGAAVQVCAAFKMQVQAAVILSLIHISAGLLGLDPGTCMVLEDSPNGIAAAHAAGCIPVMVPDLTQPDPALRALCARVVPSLDQVIPLLELL